MYSLKKHAKGFTLIEIMIVIGILSLLASISIYSYTQYRTDSAKRVLLSDTKNCLNACLAKFGNNPDASCEQSDCALSVYTSSCVFDLAGPVYVSCDGAGIIAGQRCSVYQNGQVQCGR